MKSKNGGRNTRAGSLVTFRRGTHLFGAQTDFGDAAIADNDPLKVAYRDLMSKLDVDIKEGMSPYNLLGRPAGIGEKDKYPSLYTQDKAEYKETYRLMVGLALDLMEKKGVPYVNQFLRGSLIEDAAAEAVNVSKAIEKDNSILPDMKRMQLGNVVINYVRDVMSKHGGRIVNGDNAATLKVTAAYLAEVFNRQNKALIQTSPDGRCKRGSILGEMTTSVIDETQQAILRVEESISQGEKSKMEAAKRRLSAAPASKGFSWQSIAAFGGCVSLPDEAIIHIARPDLDVVRKGRGVRAMAVIDENAALALVPADGKRLSGLL